MKRYEPSPSSGHVRALQLAQQRDPPGTSHAVLDQCLRSQSKRNTPCFGQTWWRLCPHLFLGTADASPTTISTDLTPSPPLPSYLSAPSTPGGSSFSASPLPDTNEDGGRGGHRHRRRRAGWAGGGRGTAQVPIRLPTP
ncbi:hypothetical protein BHM03_00033338 [Ensete ventricosum]|nr:hypothetical protein BHM03_00033338 [Ensete ventricosum]